MKTTNSITSGSSVPFGSPKFKNRKTNPRISIDTEELMELSDQLMDLVEELDDVKEDLQEMLTGMMSESDSGNYDAQYHAAGTESESVKKMRRISASVNSAYEELNEALDMMAELQVF